MDMAIWEKLPCCNEFMCYIFFRFEALMISGMIFCPKHAVTPVKSPPKERQRKKGRDEGEN